MSPIKFDPRVDPTIQHFKWFVVAAVVFPLFARVLWLVFEQRLLVKVPGVTELWQFVVSICPVYLVIAGLLASVTIIGLLGLLITEGSLTDCGGSDDG